MFKKKYIAAVLSLTVISASLLATSAGASADLSKQKVPDAICNTANGYAQPTILPVAAAAALWVGEAALAGAVGWAVGKALDYLVGCSNDFTTDQGNTDIVFDN